MKLPWFGDQCVICLRHGPLSEEHVIPSSLAGDLTCDFICKSCNDGFGSTFEAKAKTDPAIRLAVANLSGALPDAVIQRIEEGQEWIAQSGSIRARATYREGEVIPKTFRHADGSLMVPTTDAADHLKRIAAKSGYDIRDDTERHSEVSKHT
jgi:hypothetical protein